MLKDRLSELGWLAWFLVIVVIVAAVIFGIYALTRPASLAVERNAVEQSKSYIDANNTALNNYIVDYEAAGASDGQKKAIISTMCQMIGSMPSGTVSPVVTKFIATHGGCNEGQ